MIFAVIIEIIQWVMGDKPCYIMKTLNYSIIQQSRKKLLILSANSFYNSNYDITQ
jgi:hypothetical protein